MVWVCHSPFDPMSRHISPEQPIVTQIQLLEKANHPNIVKFYGAYHDEETGELILVMERMKENLRECLGPHYVNR